MKVSPCIRWKFFGSRAPHRISRERTGVHSWYNCFIGHSGLSQFCLPGLKLFYSYDTEYIVASVVSLTPPRHGPMSWCRTGSRKVAVQLPVRQRCVASLRKLFTPLCFCRDHKLTAGSKTVKRKWVLHPVSQSCERPMPTGSHLPYSPGW